LRIVKDFLGSPGLTKFATEGNANITLRGDDFKSISTSSNSFRNDPPGSPLRSTQQIPLDWSKFENHTFFSSAEVNVNVTFNSIINGYPFDGTKNEIIYFLDNLTGYEKWIYDQFPKNRGTLHFSNSKIIVNDVPGTTYSELSRKKDGQSVLDSGKDSISFQFKGFFENIANDNQVIFQKLINTSGYTLALSASTSIDTCNLVFIVSSGSSYISASHEVDKGKWIDITAVFDKKSIFNKLFIYKEGKKVATSTKSSEFHEFNISNSKLIIGSGSSHIFGTNSFVPVETFSGSLDDFKIFHGNRTDEEILNAVLENQYPEEKLKLFFKFNEPSGSYAQNSLVIDSSTNGLHSNIINYSNQLRKNQHGLATFREDIYENPILFPDFEDLVSLNQKLLSSASLYDEVNPNLITKLVPPHYFFEGKLEQGFETDTGPISETYYSDKTLPREAVLGASQILSGLLYIWAKQFDEIKVFLDHFSKIESYEYDQNGSIADQFLIQQARNMGIDLPKLFETVKPSDEDSGDDFGIQLKLPGGYTLQEIQSKIWRRLLASVPNIIRGKGTISSIKELIRAFGINPDTSVRLREYGGSREDILETRRSRRISCNKLLVKDNYIIESQFLSGTRIEPGVPLPKGNLGANGSDDPSDGLLTSGSWTYESTYRFPETQFWNTQSLIRFYITGSTGESLVFNLVSERTGSVEDGTVSLKLYGCTDANISNNFLIFSENVPLYDGDRWHISFGRDKKNEIESFYFLRAGKQISGQISNLVENKIKVTSSIGNDILSTLDSTFNASGSYFRLGNYNSHSSNAFIDTTVITGAAPGNFSGEVSNVRFYSKYLYDTEWYEHISNHESFGVKNPILNYNFNTNDSGSFERLRMDVSFEQNITSSDSFGQISFFDFSQNNLHLNGYNFLPNDTIIGIDDVIFSSLEPKFDERSTDNKVRIRSLNDFELAKAYRAEITPIYEVPRYEEPSDDNRFGIEISTVQALNEDIIKMFSDLSAMDMAIGDPTNSFEIDYIDLEDLRDTYFDRLVGIPQYSNVILFSKWFETTLGKLIEQFIPGNTKFLGINLVVESHMLERSKMKYNWGEIYLGENNRKNLRGTIKLAQLVANVRR
jgi:hypothetical protein